MQCKVKILYQVFSRHRKPFFHVVWLRYGLANAIPWHSERVLKPEKAEMSDDCANDLNTV